MFEKVLSEARTYTWPVFIASGMADGTSSAGVGSCFLLNDEGWALTARHLFQPMERAERDSPSANAYRSAIEEVANEINDQKRKSRRKRLDKEHKPKDILSGLAYIWSNPDIALTQVHHHPAADISLVKLEVPTKHMPSTFPRFCEAEVLPGTPTVKLGFPFVDIKSTYDFGSNNLDIQLNQLAHFPLDGIVTRAVNIDHGAAGIEYLLETSRPGIKGQSGGPTLNGSGEVVALQSKTNSMWLDFNAQAPNDPSSQRTEQYLNVGLGVHVSQLLQFMEEHDIKTMA